MKKYGANLSDYTLNVSKVLELVRENIKSMILFLIAGMFIAGVVVFFWITPKYSSTVDLLVNQKTDNLQAQYTMQQADLQSINTYKDVIRKPVILESVLKQAREQDNYKGTLKDLQNEISVTNETNSQVLSVTVTDTNPYIARDLANMIGENFKSKIKKIMKVNNVTIVSKATLNPQQVSPNKKLWVLAGAVIGLFIGFIIALIRDFLDVTVKNEEFLTDDLGLTNLGVIYHIESKNDHDYQIVEILEDDDNGTNSHRRV